MTRTSRIALIVLILAIAAFFRLWQLHQTPPGLFPDEAMNGNNLHEALRTGNFKMFYRENNGREGLFINLQAISVSIFGHTAFALRLMSALFGIATVFAIYGLARAYTGSDSIGLLAGFFAATSFWHLVFSRMGFRAIMAPFFLSAGLWGLYAAWNHTLDKNHKRTLIIAAVGGFFFGLGFHSYIAYRIAPIIAFPALLLFVKAARERKDACVLCIPAVFVFMAIIAATPLLLYFAQNPQDFFGRTSQISIFSLPSPLKALGENIAKTIGMLYVAGDFNWRHNFAGAPALWWPTAIFFTLGVIVSARRRYWMLFLAFSAMLLPVVISSEGIPHALRSIVLIPSVMIFAAVGFDALWESVLAWFRAAEKKYPEAASIIVRIQKWVSILAVVILIGTAVQTFNLYFQRWAILPQVFEAYQANLYETGLYINTLPVDVPKYVLTDEVDSIDVTGRPMALEPVLFVTETYLPEPPGTRNIHYITMRDIPNMDCNKSCFVIPLNTKEHAAGIAEIVRKSFPILRGKKDAPIFVLTPNGI